MDYTRYSAEPKYLFGLENRDKVQYVAMDMWTPYKDAVRAVLPDATVVVDKFHVVRMANVAMESVRKSIREDLTTKQRRGLMHDRFVLLKRQRDLNDQEHLLMDGWTKNYPALGEAYRLKEAFYDIYDAPTKAEAAERLDEWRASVPAGMKKGKKSFLPLLTSTKNWREEMLAFFDYPITNGYTEAVNGVAKVINRAGRGYSFEVLRARLLFGKGTQPSQSPELVEGERVRIDIGRRVTTADRRWLIAEASNRCQSCHGVFESDELDIHHAGPIVPGETAERMVVCRPCHHRFHTEECSKHGSSSTR